MKHYGEYERDACVILGYNTSLGRTLVLPLTQVSEADQTWLADFVAQNQNADALAPVLMTEVYNNLNAFAVFSAKAVQVPVHLVKINDRNQAEAWVGSSAQFSDRIVPHNFARRVSESPRFREAAPLRHQPAPVNQHFEETVAFVGGQPQQNPTPQVDTPMYNPQPISSPNSDMDVIKQLLGNIADRLTKVEVQQAKSKGGRPPGSSRNAKKS